MKISFFGMSDIGRVRHRNDDSWDANLYSNVFAVADGIGGKVGGHVASRLAIDLLMNCFDRERQAIQRISDRDYRWFLNRTCNVLNSRIYRKGLQDNLAGMGTTLSFIHVRHRQVWVSHVGDSRIYLLRNGGLQKLTEDHSLANHLCDQYGMARTAPAVLPYKHVLINSLGQPRKATPDICSLSFYKGDLFCLCSDGLTNVVLESDLRYILSLPLDLSEKAHLLTNLANDRGGDDNVTIVLVQMY